MVTPDPASGGDGATKYCWDCGDPVTEGMDFCSNCGANLDGPTDTGRTDPVEDTGGSTVTTDSQWYTYIFVGIVTLTVGLFAYAATASAAPTATSRGGALALLLTYTGVGILLVSVYKDTTHIARHSEWSPRRWFWTIGAFVGVVNYVVVAVYARRRADRTGQSWVPRNPLRGADDDLVSFDLPRISLTLLVFLFYNWVLWFAAPDLGSVLVGLISIWEVTGTTVLGSSTTYTITGYSPIGGVVSLLASYGLVWLAVTKYGG
ncbi:zinc ribbon domain-containing protein [Halorientalis pallida]|uniref:zinc ribbon domain-containing protein n=1 Tax=Halorientalis pallida TaxID=2479928 RepID=UPI003C7044BF